MQSSQLDPLPKDLPFRFISKTIGRGAYASIKKAIPLEESSPVFAVKLIHKGYAIKHGRISAKQINMEVSLHSHIGQHPNIIEWFAAGEDNVWKWIAMEYAAGGDLFDKIEADVGVPEKIAHLYFLQLIGSVSFMHSKGVAHRDLKPENILLSESGDLKLADFGMATMFEYKGQRKLSATMCGSPPYIAPEVLETARSDQRAIQSRYSADLVDIWSCGVILFVLLAGNTPWDEPTKGSWEFQEYIRTDGRSTDSLWQRIPSEALSLLRGMMNVDPRKRFSFTKIRQHPWYTQHNSLLTADGRVSDPIHLATQMMKNLHIDLSQAPTPSQRQSQDDSMDLDGGSDAWAAKFSATQPETPTITDALFDWERPSLRTLGAFEVSSTQPVRRGMSSGASTKANRARAADMYEMLSETEPSMSQFASTPGVPMSLTQRANRFHDIVPSYSLTRFFSHIPPALLIQMLSDALHQLNIPQPPAPRPVDGDHIALLKVKGVDTRNQGLHGDIMIDKIVFEGDHELLEVRFVKVKGDPLEWRRLFKKVALLCKDAIFNSDA